MATIRRMRFAMIALILFDIVEHIQKLKKLQVVRSEWKETLDFSTSVNEPNGEDSVHRHSILSEHPSPVTSTVFALLEENFTHAFMFSARVWRNPL